MSDQAAREATAEEWAARIVGVNEAVLATALKAAEARGFARGRRQSSPALEHFEVAYRYASGAKERMAVAHPPEGMTAAEYVDDAFASAKIMADIAYREWFKTSAPKGSTEKQ